MYSTAPPTSGTNRRRRGGAADPPGLAIAPGSGEVYGPTRLTSGPKMPDVSPDLLAQLSPSDQTLPPRPYPKPQSPSKDAPGGALAFILGTAFGGLRGGASAATGYLSGAQQANQVQYERDLAQYEDEQKRQLADFKQKMDLAGLGIRQDTLAETGRHNAATEGLGQKRLGLDQSNADRNYNLQVDQFGNLRSNQDRMFGLDQSKFDYTQQHDQQQRADDQTRQVHAALLENWRHYTQVYNDRTLDPAIRNNAAQVLRQISPTLGIPDTLPPAGQPDPVLAQSPFTPQQAFDNNMAQGRFAETKRHNRADESLGYSAAGRADRAFDFNREKFTYQQGQDAADRTDRNQTRQQTQAEKQQALASKASKDAADNLKRLSEIDGEIAVAQNQLRDLTAKNTTKQTGLFYTNPHDVLDPTVKPVVDSVKERITNLQAEKAWRQGRRKTSRK